MAAIFRWLNSPASLFSSLNGQEKPAPLTSDGPKVSDVLTVKQLILHISDLPLELIDLIIDYAEYWPHTTTPLLSAPVTAIAPRNENRMIMRSLPVGYVPSETSPGYQLVSDSDEEKQEYSFKDPLPCPEGTKVPDDATEEVLEHWLSDSRPRAEHPCRKIVFTFTSHDQGWGGEAGCQGTYKGSFSWFDVGLERISATRNENSLPSLVNNDGLFRMEDTKTGAINCILRTIKPTAVPSAESSDSNHSGDSDQSGPRPWGEFIHPLIPDDTVLQKNLTATRTDKYYKIVWSADDHILPDSPEADALEAQGRGRATASGEFVRNLKPGDVITVWAKARFHGWVNHVKHMEIEVYWAV